MNDPFLNFIKGNPHKVAGHSERKHSKYSASGAERWFNCPGSVALCEGLPDKPNQYSIEGTLAHEVLESIVRGQYVKRQSTTDAMIYYCEQVARFLEKLRKKHPDADFLIEERVFLDFIHPEAFGTLDYSIVDYYETLHILDFKYGKAFVSPIDNLQFIFYALAVARLHHWNFKRVRMWTLQPRVRGMFDADHCGPPFWEITIQELKKWVYNFEGAITDTIKQPKLYVEGSWCGWCRAKSICPLKQEKTFQKAKNIFTSVLLPE